MTAETIKFTASAPASVVVDKPFRIIYSVNGVAKDLKVPDFNNFEILAGPYQSTNSSYQIINGKTSSSISNSFTFTVQGLKTGTFTVPPASIVVDGQKYVSNGLSIKVLPNDDNASAKSEQANQSTNTATQSISNENIFIRTNVSKTNVYEQEAILVTYKLYYTVDVMGVADVKLPDFNGFMKQEFSQNENVQKSYENFNGKNYATAVLYKVLLYPQRSGEILIDKANFEIVVQVPNKTQVRSIFDDFFGEPYTKVKKKVVAPASRISVNQLPANKPATFNGTIGHFSVASSISSNKIKTNEAVTIKLVISGSGNMKMIKTPEIKFPDGFEVYDPKIKNDFKTTTNGVSGSKTIEYMFIPRNEGNYEIKAVDFTYFDLVEKKYKTIKSSDYQIEVVKGEGDGGIVAGTYVNKEDVKQLAKDIRFIEKSSGDLAVEKEPLFGTWLAWLLYIIPAIVVAGLFFVFRKQTENNSDVELVRNRKANKQAQKRLKLALKLLKEGNKDQFYEEVLKSVWNYLSDKLAIPAASLTKERIESELVARGVDAVLIEEFKNILNVCEFARYAPNSGQQAMDNLYDVTINAISNLENIIRKA